MLKKCWADLAKDYCVVVSHFSSVYPRQNQHKYLISFPVQCSLLFIKIDSEIFSAQISQMKKYQSQFMPSGCSVFKEMQKESKLTAPLSLGNTFSFSIVAEQHSAITYISWDLSQGEIPQSFLIPCYIFSSQQSQ